MSAVIIGVILLSTFRDIVLMLSFHFVVGN